MAAASRGCRCAGSLKGHSLGSQVRRSTNQYRERLYKEVNEFRKIEKEQDQMQAKRVERASASRRSPQHGQGGYGQSAAARPGHQPTARRTDEPLANRGAMRQDCAQPVGAV